MPKVFHVKIFLHKSPGSLTLSLLLLKVKKKTDTKQFWQRTSGPEQEDWPNRWHLLLDDGRFGHCTLEREKKKWMLQAAPVKQSCKTQARPSSSCRTSPTIPIRVSSIRHEFRWLSLQLNVKNDDTCEASKVDDSEALAKSGQRSTKRIQNNKIFPLCSLRNLKFS